MIVNNQLAGLAAALLSAISGPQIERANGPENKTGNSGISLVDESARELKQDPVEQLRLRIGLSIPNGITNAAKEKLLNEAEDSIRHWNDCARVLCSFDLAITQADILKSEFSAKQLSSTITSVIGELDLTDKGREALTQRLVVPLEQKVKLCSDAPSPQERQAAIESLMSTDFRSLQKDVHLEVLKARGSAPRISKELATSALGEIENCLRRIEVTLPKKSDQNGAVLDNSKAESAAIHAGREQLTGELAEKLDLLFPKLVNGAPRVSLYSLNADQWASKLADLRGLIKSTTEMLKLN